MGDSTGAFNAWTHCEDFIPGPIADNEKEERK